MHAWGLRLRRASDALALAHTTVLPSVQRDAVGALDSRFRSSSTSGIPSLHMPLSNASSTSLPPPSHGSGSGWFATPFLYDSFIHYFTPVYPDAIHAKACATNVKFQHTCIHSGYTSAAGTKEKLRVTRSFTRRVDGPQCAVATVLSHSCGGCRRVTLAPRRPNGVLWLFVFVNRRTPDEPAVRLLQLPLLLWARDFSKEGVVPRLCSDNSRL
jgi:hypothetical protein